jgi:hypothetical protein
VATSPQGQEVTVRAVIEFKEAMEHPSVGIAIENEEHKVVFAANSIWTNERTGRFEAGERATMTVRFANVFTPGRYFVSPAIAARGTALELADHRPRLRSFVSTGSFVTGGIVDLDHDLRLVPGAVSPPAALEAVSP